MIGLIIVAGLLVLIWQYTAIRVTTFTIIKPSELIDIATEWSKWGFGSIGKGFAYLSSFYVYLKLADFFKAICQLGLSFWHFVTSVFELVVGYDETAKTYEHPGLIWFGSLTLLVLLIYGVIRYFKLDSAWVYRHSHILLFLTYELFILAMMALLYWRDPTDWKGWISFSGLFILGWFAWYHRRQLPLVNAWLNQLNGPHPN